MVPKLIAQASNPTPLGQIEGFGSGFFKTAGASPETRVAALISNIVSVLTIFGGLAFALWFVIGALNWITSSGNPEQVEKAKRQMSSAVVGLFVLVLTTSIAYIVGKISGIEILELEKMVNKLTP